MKSLSELEDQLYEYVSFHTKQTVEELKASTPVEKLVELAHEIMDRLRAAENWALAEGQKGIIQLTSFFNHYHVFVHNSASALPPEQPNIPKAEPQGVLDQSTSDLTPETTPVDVNDLASLYQEAASNQDRGNTPVSAVVDSPATAPAGESKE
jgi:hypothetical protein